MTRYPGKLKLGRQHRGIGQHAAAFRMTRYPGKLKPWQQISGVTTSLLQFRMTRYPGKLKLSEAKAEGVQNTSSG